MNTNAVEHTCPLINEVIDAIKSKDWVDTYWDTDFLVSTMEKIRKANEMLRSIGEEKTKECDNLESQVSDLEKDIKSLNEEIYDLKITNSQLESQIYDLENE